MKLENRFFLSIGLATLLLTACVASAVDFITGTGASFPFSIYTKWSTAYLSQSGILVEYNPIGSSGGVEKILAKSVNFGATDIPMTQGELEKNDLIQIPTVIGGVVPVVNLEGVAEGQLKLSSEVLADIFLGKITKWNDVRISADNNGVKLPNQEITVIHRIDGSGSTYNFTSYLSQVSPEWKFSMGAGNIIPWKTGVGVQGGEGVVTIIKGTRGTIGYLDYATVNQSKINYAQMKNRDGNFVKPDVNSFKAAAIGIESSECFCEAMINKPGKESWPITSATFVLVPNTWNAKNVLNFFEWTHGEEGSRIAIDLGYVPLPEEVHKKIKGIWWNQVWKKVLKMVME